MTGNDGASALPLHSLHEPLDGFLPEVVVAFEDEYFVEWQVAPLAVVGPENQIFLR